VQVLIRGRSAHAGVEPERGRSAIVEAARKILELASLGDDTSGASVNVGVVQGGTRPNVVPDGCRLDIDLRATTERGMQRLEHAIEGIARRSYVPDTSSEALFEVWQRPMERTPAVGFLAATARRVAARLGFELSDAATGGASDANCIASQGTPVLDGLGPIGGDDHGPSEWLDLESVVPRTALLAGLMTAVSRSEVLERVRALR
jgi:glutamate carboxypeptidase